MNRLVTHILLATGLITTPALAAADENTPNCDALDHGETDHVQVNGDIDFENGRLVFHENGDEYMVITNDRELFIDGKRIELDTRGEELVGQYYGTVDEVVDDAMDLAGDAAGLGVSAAIEALAMVFSGEDDMREFEDRIEEEAREIEAKADSMCAHLLDIENIERELQQLVPEFEPRLFVQSLATVE